MNIAITFRQMEATDAVRTYAEDKVGKLQKFLRQPLKGHVTMSCQNHRHHKVEVQLQAGGEHFHAHLTSEDMYASIDGVADKLERQIREVKGSARDKRGAGAERTSDWLLDGTDGE